MFSSECSLRQVWHGLLDHVWLLDSRVGIVSGLYVHLLTSLVSRLPGLDVPASLVQQVTHSCCLQRQVGRAIISLPIALIPVL